MEEAIRNNRNKIRTVEIAVLGTILALALMVNLGAHGPFPKSTVIVYAAGTPDIKGNQIYYVDLWQNTTGSWQLIAFTEQSTYESGVNLTIDSNQHTIIEVALRLNYSLASSMADAYTKTRVYLNISTVCTNSLMTATGNSGWDYPNYWIPYFAYPSLAKWSPYTGATWIPQPGITYNVTILYQAYY